LTRVFFIKLKKLNLKKIKKKLKKLKKIKKSQKWHVAWYWLDTCIYF